jgi:tartrate dehydratase beta subunit/fumarate hydratase class I family protein|tara:strand:+ start:1331 stop:1474 length:144 start_codon:yes stop_codon:yes gene_type:complete
MKGIVHKAIKWGLDRKKSVEEIQQFIYLKHKITVCRDAIKKRIKYNH